MLECVPNVAEGRDARVLDALRTACGSSLLDVHTDPDHHRSVFTLAGPDRCDAEPAVRRLADSVAEHVDLTTHAGVHPRIGALDVVPFVALDGTTAGEAVDAAHAFATWVVDALRLPVFLYGDADAAPSLASRAPPRRVHVARARLRSVGTPPEAWARSRSARVPCSWR